MPSDGELWSGSMLKQEGGGLFFWGLGQPPQTIVQASASQSAGPGVSHDGGQLAQK